MFEAAEQGHAIDRAVWKASVPALREALLELQIQLRELAEFPVVVLVNGLDGAGKGETVNLLNAWMDPRLIDTTAFGDATSDDLNRPYMWRFWQALPGKGRIGILFGSWYSDPIDQHVAGQIGRAELDQRIAEINRFERMLVREGALLIKLWFHLSKREQKKRLESLESDELTRWRVTTADWENLEQHAHIRKAAEHVLLKTSSASAPWTVIDGSDANFRYLTAAETLKRGLERRLKGVIAPPVEAAPFAAPLDGQYLLDKLDLNQQMSRESYTLELEKWQGRLALACRHPDFQRHSVVVVFEGHDAAGKGGSIRRVASALDARTYRIIPIAAPSEEERAQPYLWRFWRHVPAKGRFAMFDRSWYGRVLVERVEGYASESDWMRAYEEINDFERQLKESGVILVKFWLAIDKKEQLARFESRQNTEFKRFKITDEDWRNREKWDEYARAIHDMVDRTGSSDRPWTLVEANNKYFARIKVLKTLCHAIEARLKHA
ncbi:polyphosphate:AMP phosphotransferase [Burkholderiaceae bacterium DAT-1]|nr:polyphosphate:AMP phosphotransferase [Burkholderiaceae bacterium DAT-1]